MERGRIERVLNGLIDDLAGIEHERWSHWQRYMHGKGERQSDGSIVLPAALVARWEAQVAKTYDQLSEDEKESDREQVRRYLPIIAASLADV